MDLSVWGAFLAQLFFLAVTTSVALSLVVGVALASFGRFPIWLGILGTIFLPILGPFVLLIVAIVRATSFAVATQVKRHQTRALELTPAGIAAIDGPAGKEVALVEGSLMEGAVEEVAVEKAVRKPGIVGALSPMRLFSRFGFPFVVTLALLVFGAASTLVLQWIVIDLVVVPPFVLTAWGSGLDVAVILSVGILVIALGLAIFRPSRLAAVFVAAIGSGWTLAGAAGMLLVQPVQTTLATANSTFVEVLGGFGPVAGSIVASALGSEYEQVTSIRLTYVGELPSVHFGPATSIAFLVGVLLLAWSLVEVFAAHRRSRRALAATGS